MRLRLDMKLLWLRVTHLDVRDWLLRWVFAQHNARVLADFERRMCVVINAATGNRMSKAYYTEEVMLAEIREAFSREFDEGYAEGRRDLAEEADIADPSPFVPEHYA